MKEHMLLSILLIALLCISLMGCASIANYTTGYVPTEFPVLPTSTNTVPAPTVPTTVTTTAPTPTTVPPVPTVDIVMELTEDVKNELSAAWIPFANEELAWEAKNNIGEDRVQYHGSFNDKHILVIVEDCPIVTVNYDLFIGPYILSNNTQFEIYVYYAGEFVTLKMAYDDMTFSDEEVSAVFDYLQTVFSDE